MQYTNLIWRNGQPYSEMFDDIYYSSNEGEGISGEYEFKHVFLKNNGLPERWLISENFTIAELGFGSGLNFLLTVREWLKHLAETKQDKCLHYIAIEKYPLSPDAIAQLASRYPELKSYCDELLVCYPPAVEGSHSRHLFNNKVVIHFKFKDVLSALNDEYFNVDAWYLDGFSPAKNSDMWSEQLFLKLAQNSRAGATCSTYTAAGYVRRNMQNAGFLVKKVKGYGKKHEMLTATYTVEDAQEYREKFKAYKFSDKPWFQTNHNPKVYSDKHAVIIGAGIAGLSMAYALIKRGWVITIIDKHGAVAKETSSNPAAIVYPRLSINNHVDNEFFISAFCLSVSLMERLQNKYLKKFWFGCGFLHEIDEKKAVALLAKYSFNKDFISLSTVKEKKYSSWANFHYKTAGVVLPNILCDVLKQECGDNLSIVSEEVHNINFDNDRWHCYSDKASILSSEVLIVASGATVKDIELPIDLPVDIIRGQIVTLNESEQSKSITSTLASKITFSPAINGKHYLGASYSRDNKSIDVDSNETAALIESLNTAFHYDFSALDCIDDWVGFRSMSIDRVPIVGAVPDRKYFEKEYGDICHGKKHKVYSLGKNLKGLYLSLGHGSRGFTSAFLSSEIISAQIVGEPAPVERMVLNYLTPSRFIINDLKRR